MAWATVCLGIVPLVLLARHFELQDADWLPLSAQLRIVMWNKIALLVPEAPVLGVGADMTYVIRPLLTEAPAAAQTWIGFPIPHPHNLYLQTWYELGLVGAALLAAFGFLLLGQMHRLGPAQRPYAYAMFAATAVAVGSSYNVWQIWFMCCLGFSAAMFALASHAARLANIPHGELNSVH